MKLISIISVSVFFFLIIVLSIVFKKKYGIRYSFRILFSATILLLCTILISLFGDLTTMADGDLSQSSKLSWLVLIVTSTYALGQFVSWIIYSFAYKYNLIRIPRFLFNVFTFLIVLAIGLYAASYLFGFDLSGILVTSTVVSAIIGFSLQDTLGNFFAGLSLQMEAPFKLDDWVNLGGHEGKVVDQSWRSLTLLTGTDHRIILPNKVVAEEKIVNYSRPTTRQLFGFIIKIDYVYPPEKVLRILNKCIDDVDGVERDKDGMPYIFALEKKHIKYKVNYWIDNYAYRLSLTSKVNAKLWYEFKRNNIHFLVRKNNPKRPQPYFEKYTTDYIVTKLKEQSWLSTLDENMINTIATEAKIEHYTTGENLVTQGNKGDTLYMIVSGTGSVLINDDTGNAILVATKGAGEFFGEMSLLTGEPTSATVRANTEMDVIVLNKASFKRLINNNESILLILVTALENNKSSLSDILEEERKKYNKTAVSARQVFISRIKDYLHIK